MEESDGATVSMERLGLPLHQRTMIGELEASVVRIFDAAGGIAGAGFLVSERHVLTCAHVVCSALGVQDAIPEMPQAVLHVDFPLVAKGTTLTARPIFWRPAASVIATSSEDAEDVAALEILTDPPSSSRPSRLVVVSDLWGHGFRAFGFPPRRDEGVWATGVMRGRQAAGWVQIEDVKEAGYRVEPGFSGAPVWDEVIGGVVGMAVAAESQPDVRAAFIIPADVLMAAWPVLEQRARSLSVRTIDDRLHSLSRWMPRPSTKQDKSASSTNPNSTQWPLVGRDMERTFVAEAIAARQGGVVLAGHAGVGKTRLALEALREAERKGCWTTWVVATKVATSIPFGPFAHLLTQHAASISRLDLLRQISEGLITRAAGRRVVIGVDDAHLLDDASAALVHQLAVTGDAFVILTIRVGTPAPDSIVALWKDGVAGRLELQTLSGEEVAELLPRVLGGQVDATTITKLWNNTLGNALFLRELVLAGLESATLVKAGGVWSWKGAMAMSIRLQEIVATRLGTLDTDQVSLMEVVAYGEPVPASIVERISSETALDVAERRGLVAVSVEGRRTLVRLAHPLYGEWVRERCPTLRARSVHRRLAEAIEATGGHRGEDVLRLATFRLEAGDLGRPDILLAGAQRAMAVFDLDLSERLARAAADAGGGIAAKLVVAQTLVEQGRGLEAAELLSHVDDVDLTENDTAVASGLRAYALSILGQPAEAEQILLQAEKSLHDSVLRDELKSMRARILLLAGQPQQTIRIFEALERAGGDEGACVRAVANAAMALAMVGRAEQAVATAKGWMSRARRLAAEQPNAPLMMRWSESWALCLAGRLADAERVAKEVHQEAVSRNAEATRAMAAFTLGVAALIRGRVAVAVRWLREAVAASRRPSRYNHLPAYLAALTQASVLTRDLAGAETALAEADEAINAGFALLQPMLTLARGWLAAGHGEISRARLLALEASNEAEASGQHAIAVVALHDLARFGEPYPSRLNQLAALVDGPFAPVCVLHATALGTQNGERLDQVAADFAAIGSDLLAAEAAAEAAVAHRAKRNRPGMLASSAHARQHLKTCEGARTPALLLLDATSLLKDPER